MTDRVLTETQLMETEAFLAKRFDWTPEEWTKLAALTTSHRLLQQRVKELEVEGNPVDLYAIAAAHTAQWRREIKDVTV